MKERKGGGQLFREYYAHWVSIYKEGAVRPVTLAKYQMTQSWVERLLPELRVQELTRIIYQQLINDYARFHGLPSPAEGRHLGCGR